jgi:hypothetical protein
MRALGDYYAQWGRIVLGSVHQLQGVNNKMVVKLHSQLDASRDQVDEFVGAILNLRAVRDGGRRTAAGERQDRRLADRDREARAPAARRRRQGVPGRAGVTPEMADVLGTLGQSPDLMATLGDPDVRVLMQDPNNLKMLAGLLKQAAAQQNARARRAGPEHPGRLNPPSPNTSTARVRRGAGDRHAPRPTDPEDPHVPRHRARVLRPAFEHRRKKDLAAAMEEWSELDERRAELRRRPPAVPQPEGPGRHAPRAPRAARPPRRGRRRRRPGARRSTSTLPPEPGAEDDLLDGPSRTRRTRTSSGRSGSTSPNPAPGRSATTRTRGLRCVDDGTGCRVDVDAPPPDDPRATVEGA